MQLTYLPSIFQNELFSYVAMRGDHCQNNPHYEIIYLVHFIIGFQVKY